MFSDGKAPVSAKTSDSSEVKPQRKVNADRRRLDRGMSMSLVSAKKAPERRLDRRMSKSLVSAEEAPTRAEKFNTSEDRPQRKAKTDRRRLDRHKSMPDVGAQMKEEALQIRLEKYEFTCNQLSFII